MRLFTADEMRSIDTRARTEYGTPSLLLMENAGRAVAERALALLQAGPTSKVSHPPLQEPTYGTTPEQDSPRIGGWGASPRSQGTVVILCGKGNNGGDGFVAARHLFNRGVPVTVLLAGNPDEIGGDARVNYNQLGPLGVPVAPYNGDLPGDGCSPLIVIDALLGTGFSGEPRGIVADSIRAINAARVPVLSVDIPSGLNADSGHAPGACVRAAETVTFGGPKVGLTTGHGPGVCGRITVANISIPCALLASGDPSALWLTAAEARPLWPPRGLLAHKGEAGRLFVLAGSIGFVGAATLVCEAALRSGAGLVTLGAPRSLVPTVAAKLTEAMTLPLPETDTGAHSPESLDEVLARAAEAGAVVIGPGFGRDPRSGELVRAFVTACSTPLVVDADALFHLAPAHSASFPTHCIVTPHPAEMARLLGTSTEEVQSNRIQSAGEAAARLGCVVILKGPGTVIAAPSITASEARQGSIVINSSGGPALATGGTGDVLSGIAGACLARGLEPLLAAQAAVFLHGIAGEIAGERYGAPGAIAGDVIAAIPEALRRLATGEILPPYQFI